MVEHRDRTKRRAIQVAAYVLSLQIEEMRVKKGQASYKKYVPDDANGFQLYGNEMAMRNRSIHQQAADKFGYKNTKTVQRLIRLVERKGWGREVLELYERDPAAEIGDAANRRGFEIPEGIKQILGLLSLGG